MINWLLLWSGYIITLAISELINEFVDKKYIKSYKLLAEKRGIDWEVFEEQIYKEDLLFLATTLFSDVVPGLNILMALRRLIIKDKRVKKVAENMQVYISTNKSSYNDFQFSEKRKREHEKYFVGYFEENHPRNIWFKYDGKDIMIMDTSSSTYWSLSDEEKAQRLMYILYRIYLGDSKDFSACPYLGEIYDDNLIQNLLASFENEDVSYEVEKVTVENMDSEISRARKRPNSTKR